MKILIVAINYTQEGIRTIANIGTYNPEIGLSVAEWCDMYYSKQYDEVYTIEMDNNHREFIDYIVTHGCRM